jgi:hypothetical protein
MPRILATATTRAVAKYNMVNEAQNQNNMAGLIANLATAVSEQADVRSWNMLPASIQVARTKVPAGGQVNIPPWNDIDPHTLQAAAQGRKAVVVVGELSTKPLGYPSAPVAATAPTSPSTPPSTSTEAGISP